EERAAAGKEEGTARQGQRAQASRAAARASAVAAPSSGRAASSRKEIAAEDTDQAPSFRSGRSAAVKPCLCSSAADAACAPGPRASGLGPPVQQSSQEARGPRPEAPAAPTLVRLTCGLLVLLGVSIAHAQSGEPPDMKPAAKIYED